MRQWANMEWVGNESIPEEHVPTDGTAGGEETLRVTTPPAGWTGTQPGERSTLEGIGPMTVHGGWFGPVGNFAFYTVHDDGTGRYVGVNPQDDEPSLAGLTMVPIQISSGAQTADAVAIALETAAAATPYTISRSGNQVDITGPFVAANAAVGGD